MDSPFRPRISSTSQPNTPRMHNPFVSEAPPPPNETPEQREQRLRSLHEAQRISREIDADIAESKKAFDRKQRAIKILLLGQAESGKSTVLKNFQLAFTPSHFRSERTVWRIIIQLNLINSVKRILQTLEEEWGSGYSITRLPTSTGPYSSSSPSSSCSSASPTPFAMTSTHRRLRMSLSPLLSIESSLSRLLSDSQQQQKKLSTSLSTSVSEVTVRAGSRWKTLLTPRSNDHGARGHTHASSSSSSNELRTIRNDPTSVLAACQQDIISLWEDQTVRAILAHHGLTLETSPGFFLNDTERIATYNYEPTDSDILRARIRTLGVEEHYFVMETADTGSEYYIFDVGGSRSMRPQWIPYFDNMHAILFLAPLAFNQVLEEDPRVNRLEDSISLWREICCSPLLAGAFLILFLNKMDILEKTLASGVQVKSFVPSYNGACDAKSVTKYFKEKFKAYHRRLSPRPRPFLCYETSAIDKNVMFPILDTVRASILRSALETMAVI